jgi:fluoroacetyl-CoA thioesterase
MDARDVVKIGMSAERALIVPPERTVGHFVAGMPMVYATPMMILEMELVSGDAVKPHLEPGLGHGRHEGRYQASRRWYAPRRG